MFATAFSTAFFCSVICACHLMHYGCVIFYFFLCQRQHGRCASSLRILRSGGQAAAVPGARRRPPQRVPVAAFSRGLCAVSTRVNQHLTLILRFFGVGGRCHARGDAAAVPAAHEQQLHTPVCTARPALALPVFLCCCFRFLARVLAKSTVCNSRPSARSDYDLIKL